MTCLTYNLLTCFNIFHFLFLSDNLDTDIYGANIYNEILRNLNDSHEKKVLVRNKINNSVDSLHEDSSPKTMQNRSYLTSAYEQKFSRLDTSAFSFKSSKIESITSILVRTGVFQGNINDIDSQCSQLLLAHKDMIVDPTLIKPHFVSNDVYDAVKLIFELENV